MMNEICGLQESLLFSNILGFYFINHDSITARVWDRADFYDRERNTAGTIVISVPSPPPPVLPTIRPSVRHRVVVSAHIRRTSHGNVLKLGGYIHYGTPRGWLTMNHIVLNFAVSWPLIEVKLVFALYRFATVSWALIGWAVFVHLQPNCGSDSTQIWRNYALSASSGLASFWSCSTKFPPSSVSDCWSRFCAFVDKLMIGRRFTKPNHYELPGLIHFSHAPVNCHHFIAIDQTIFFFAFATKLLLAQICWANSLLEYILCTYLI